MKSIGGTVLVYFSYPGNYEMSLQDAEQIIAGHTTAEKYTRLMQWIKTNHVFDDVIYEHQYADFERAVGLAMVARREAELKMLKAPDNES